ncbi:hypothetical protein SK128_023129 [Halocaridina rubra]|uniref:Uncharacterized protein n=1 Tax=Halocaridina rubra TaxID=373956 RepID=A0AAN8X279_HALRR
MASQEKLWMSELRILQKEETAIKDMIEKYQNTLNRLQVEELTIRNQLGHIQDVELISRNPTPLEAREVFSPIDKPEDMLEENADIIEHNTGITMNELQINQSSLNLDAAPLIHRMLEDSTAFEEEEEDSDNV